MTTLDARTLATLVALSLAGAPVVAQQGQKPVTPGEGWLQSFDVNPAGMATIGESAYFILRPGYQLTLDGREDGRAVRLVVTVLDETKEVGGIATRVVEERETQNGALVEISRNYFAIDKRTNDVYYFGEDVDVYRAGKVVGHEGAWHHGENGARFGLMMPGRPQIGMRFYQELAPRVAMDRAEIVSLDDRLTTPAGTFDECLKTEETTPLEPGAREFKVYAPGIGLAQDGTLMLTARRKPPIAE